MFSRATHPKLKGTSYMQTFSTSVPSGASTNNVDTIRLTRDSQCKTLARVRGTTSTSIGKIIGIEKDFGPNLEYQRYNEKS